MKDNNRAYTAEEIAIICDMNLTPNQVAEILGTTSNAIRRKRQRLRNEDGMNLPQRKTGRPRIDLTEEDKNYIADTTLSKEEVAAKLGISTQTIRNRRLELQGKSPYDHKKREAKIIEVNYNFDVNAEVIRSWQDSPAILNGKIEKLQLLLDNLKNTREMRKQNKETGFEL